MLVHAQLFDWTYRQTLSYAQVPDDQGATQVARFVHERNVEPLYKLYRSLSKRSTPPSDLAKQLVDAFSKERKASWFDTSKSAYPRWGDSLGHVLNQVERFSLQAASRAQRKRMWQSWVVASGQLAELQLPSASAFGGPTPERKRNSEAANYVLSVASLDTSLVRVVRKYADDPAFRAAQPEFATEHAKIRKLGNLAIDNTPYIQLYSRSHAGAVALHRLCERLTKRRREVPGVHRKIP